MIKLNHYKIKNFILKIIKMFFIILLLSSLIEIGKRIYQKEKDREQRLTKNLIKILDQKNKKLEKEIIEKVSKIK